jgi:single-strand DNA-binding protein
MNSAQITGNIGKIEELGDANGTPVISLSVATNDWMGKAKGEVTNWHTVNVVGSSAKFIHDFGSNYKKIAVKGTIQYDQWETKEGEKRSKTKIYADDVELLSPKDSDHKAYDREKKEAAATAPKLEFPSG